MARTLQLALLLGHPLVVKRSYVETPLSNIDVKSCVCILLILVILSTQRGCLTSKSRV